MSHSEDAHITKAFAVRLLIDENLPPSLKRHLDDLFPGSIHVRDVRLAASPDSSIWDFATNGEFAILTKDRIATKAQWLKKGPPTVIQIRAGNCSVSKLVGLIRENAFQIAAAVERGDSLLDIGFFRKTAA